MNGWVLLAALLALAGGQSFLVAHFALGGVRYSRRFSKKSLYAGESAEMIEVIRNERLLFIPWLRVESRLSPYLRLGKQENLSVSGERYHKSIFTLRPYQQITRRHQARFLRRGVYEAGHVALTAGDLLGLSSRQRQLDSSAPMVVYPALLAPEEVPLPVSRFQGELLVKRHLLPDPFLIQSVRPYQYGDQLRDIHWPASARMGALQAKTHDYTADPRLLVVINCQMSEGQWSDVMEYEQAVIERAISLAATVCVRALRGGVSAGFAANMPLDETGACALLPPERHSAREEELLAAFARLRILRARNFLSFLEDLAFLKETDVLILSAYDSEALEEKMARLRRRGNTVTLYCLGKGGEGV